ncbi:MAG: GNAT family protein [Pseudomonadota bacterium]
MALLDFQVRDELNPRVRVGDVELRRPRIDHHDAWAALRRESRAHLTRWEPDWRDDDLSLPAFKDLLRGYGRAARAGLAAPFFVFREDDDAFLGGVNLVNVTRGATQSASIGYWIGAPYTRQGYGVQAVEGALSFAFGTLALNRVEAACQPENVASRDLLSKAGFRHEGYARDYLHINGAWRDHLLFAVLASDLRR